jgi:hypothetical protein
MKMRSKKLTEMPGNIAMLGLTEITVFIPVMLIQGEVHHKRGTCLPNSPFQLHY